MLLRPGQNDIEPGLSYTRRETSSPVFVSNDTGVVFVDDDRVERDEVRTSVDVEVGLPFNYVDQSLETMVGGSIGASADGSGQAFGNPRFAVASEIAGTKVPPARTNSMARTAVDGSKLVGT